ncbi:hypothetical protein [Reinekea marinisedimentorum]|uniref:DUF7847 domain-containing protein n=1 Tax=Reinekea marinisedimentorum TaxID=230495 RepID=A0A4R3ID86_9GAMM|nr:hypothetical protein [Reinekea marinisedimentorum]TCS43687.1 hypothetical protein BCF53_10129 [Reinekea marinisedimentorum]
MLYSLLRDSLRFYLNHFIRFAQIVLPFTIPLGLFSLLYDKFLLTNPESALQVYFPMAVAFLFRPVYQLALLQSISQSLQHNYPTVGSLWQMGWSKWAPMFIVSLLYTAAVFSGMMMFVIPGLYLAIKFCFAEIFVAVEGCDPVEAMKRSWKATTGRLLPLTGGFILISLLLIVPSMQIANYVTTAGIPDFIGRFIPSVIFSLLGVFYTVFTYRVFDQARKA